MLQPASWASLRDSTHARIGCLPDSGSSVQIRPRLAHALHLIASSRSTAWAASRKSLRAVHLSSATSSLHPRFIPDRLNDDRASRAVARLYPTIALLASSDSFIAFLSFPIAFDAKRSHRNSSTRLRPLIIALAMTTKLPRATTERATHHRRATQRLLRPVSPGPVHPSTDLRAVTNC